jgi:TolB protein
MFLTRWSAVAVVVLPVLSAALLGCALVAGRLLLRGDELLFVSYHEINPDIFVADIDHGLVLNLTRSQAYEAEPAWSPDGEWIAFSSDRDGVLHVYVMDASGGNIRRLTEGRRAYGAPRWSADGQRIVFFTHNGASELYSINLDGSDLRQLTSSVLQQTGILMELGIETSRATVVPSPDRSKVLFLRAEAGNWSIFLADDKRQNAHYLTILGRHYTEPPVWSPTGERIAYVGSSGSRPDIYVINVGDQRGRRVTSTPAIDVSPVWRPRT